MTKKDYIMLAEVIKFASDKKQSLERMASNLADHLKSENQMFKKEVFMEACGFPKESYTYSKR